MQAKNELPEDELRGKQVIQGTVACMDRGHMRGSEEVAARMAVFVAAGDGKGARAYVSFILGGGADLTPIRDNLRSRFSQAFMELACVECPWLAYDRLERPVGPDRLLSALQSAGATGVCRTYLKSMAKMGTSFSESLDKLVSDGVVVVSAVTTRGRTTQRYALAKDETLELEK